MLVTLRWLQQSRSHGPIPSFRQTSCRIFKIIQPPFYSNSVRQLWQSNRFQMSSSSNLMDRGTVQMQLQPEMLRMLMQQQISSGGADVGLGIGVQMSGDVAPEHSSGSRSEDGRSRKYREGGWELTGQMAGLPRSLISTPNPVVPLKFEQPPGKWQGGC